MASLDEVRREKKLAAVRAKKAAARNTPAPYSIPTVEPQSATRPRERGFWERADETMGDIALRIRQAQASILQGVMGAASDEALALADAAAGRGTLQETLAGRQRQLNEIPTALRVPGEVVGALAATVGSGGMSTLPGILGYGGAYGFNAGEGDLAQRAESAAYGAGGALAGNALFRGLARVLSPKSSPQVQTLLKEGVTPTPGQALGGAAARLEDKAVSMPIVGSAVTAGRERALNQFNIGAINRALRSAGVQLPKGTQPGAEAMQAAKRLIDNSYDDVFRGAVVGLDDTFADDIGRVAERAKQELNDQGRLAVQREIQKFATLPEFKNNQLSGRAAKAILSELRSAARDFGKDSSKYTRDVGNVLDDMAESFNRLLMRSLPEEKAAKYTGLDKAFKEMLRVENAATRAGGEVGSFTPSQLSAASRLLDKSLRKGATARGQAVGQEFAEAGRKVLNQKVPNSGTTDRLLQALLYGGAGYGTYANPTLTAALGTSYTLPALAYTPWGQRMLATLLAGRQGPVFQGAAQGVRALAPAAGAAAPAIINAGR